MEDSDPLVPPAIRALQAKLDCCPQTNSQLKSCNFYMGSGIWDPKPNNTKRISEQIGVVISAKLMQLIEFERSFDFYYCFYRLTIFWVQLSEHSSI